MTYALQYGEFRDKPLAYLRDNDPDYSDAQYLIKRWPKHFDFVNYTSFDENTHSGGPSDKANYEFWKKTYDKTEGKSWWDLGHNGGIFVRIPLLSTDEKESYEYLEDNYQIDDDRTNEIEQELQTEQWDSFGRDDFKKAIKKDMGDDEDKVEELLDAIPDRAFDVNVWHAYERANDYPEVSGWEVNFPDPKNLLEYDKNFTEWTLDGAINWLALGHNMNIRLSPKAFCRLHPEDREFNYPGAVYVRYGEEWVLNVTWDDIIGAMPGADPTYFATHGDPYGEPIAGTLEPLWQAHSDDTQKFNGLDQAPFVTVMYSKEVCQNPYLVCDINYVEEAKIAILQGPQADWDDDTQITDEMVAEQQKFDEMVAKVRNIAIDGALKCNIDPTPDMVEQVVEQIILDAPDRPASQLDYPPVQSHLLTTACDITTRFLEARPPFCTIRQLKLSGVKENPAATFPQFVHVSKNVMVTNVNRPKHSWTVQYEIMSFGGFLEKREKHFPTKREAMNFAKDIKRKAS